MATIHTYPVNDLLEHDVESDDCPCLPNVEPVETEDGGVNWLVVHNAWDGRE